VNLSMINLVDPGLPGRIAALRKQKQLPVDALKLEITETEIMSNPERVIKIMEHADMAGLMYSVDDFGTGYSSLSYLKKLPVQEVKIDRSFVTPMAEDVDDAAIVRAVVELAHGLGLVTVAEGVEDEVVLQKLVALGCDYAQGYFFSGPLPADKFVEAVNNIQTRYYEAVSSDPRLTSSITH